MNSVTQIFHPSLEIVLHSAISIIMTVIAFDMIYSKYPEPCPTSCLDIATTLALINMQQEFHYPPPSTNSNPPSSLLKSSENCNTLIY